MAKSVVIDELHVTVRVPGDLPEDVVVAVRPTLAVGEFTDRLRRAIRAVLRVYPELTACRVSLSR